MAAWTVRKEINLGDVFTMVGMMASVLLFVGIGWLSLHESIGRTQERLALAELRIDAVERSAEESRETVQELFAEIKQMIRDTNTKLDRFGEALSNKEDRK
jgi:hypothetical protein